MGREHVLPGSLARLSRFHTPSVSLACIAVSNSLLGLPLTYVYGGVHAFGYLAGAAGLSVILTYLGVNIATIRVFRREFRRDFRLVPHLLLPAAAALLLLFPLWGVLHPRTHMLVNLLPFSAFLWLGVGGLAAGAPKLKSSPKLRALGSVFVPTEDNLQGLPTDPMAPKATANDP
jgi:amino acid transporter